MNNFIFSLSNSFSSCVWLAILLVAFCPLLESKIALPLALNSAIWTNNILNPFSAFLISFVGSCLPCFFIIPLTKKLKSKTTGFISSKFADKYQVKANKISKFSTFQKYLALCGFAALPLPLTGVWSSSVIAGLTDLKIGNSIISILLGNLLSCGIVMSLCCWFKNSIGNICLISISIVIAFLMIDLIANVFKSMRAKKQDTIQRR